MKPGKPDRHREVEAAILETVLYSDLFDYPLTVSEIAHYLIRVQAEVGTIVASLDTPRHLNGHLRRVGEYVCAARREALIERRRARQSASTRLWVRARRFARVLAALPFVRLVAVTGALAMDNSAADDDIDVFIVAARGRVWTARLFAVVLVYLGKLCGDTLCPNYVVSEDALALDPHDLFTAHEFAQMVPLFGLDLFDRLRGANRWVYEYLPNAYSPLRQEREIHNGPVARLVKRIGEWTLRGRLGDAMEAWEMRRKQRKLRPQITPASNAILDRDHVKGHFDDYGIPVLQLYAERLAEFALADVEPERARQ